MAIIQGDGNGRTIINSKPISTIATGVVVGLLLMIVGAIFGMGVRSERIETNRRDIYALTERHQALQECVTEMAKNQSKLMERIDILIDLYQNKQ